MALRLDKTGQVLAEFLPNMGKSLMSIFKGGSEAAAKAAPRVATTGERWASRAGSVAFAPIKWSAGGALWVIERPIAAASWGLRQGVKGIGGFYTKMPKTAWGLTAILGAAGIGTAIAKGNEAKSNAYYQQQSGAIQQQNPYRLQEGEYTQNVAPYLKDSSTGGANFANAEQQRAAAAQNAASV